MNAKSISARLLAPLAIAAALWVTPAAARAGEIYVADSVNNRIGEYTTTGTTINASLIDVNFPVAAVLTGNDLLVGNVNSQTIGEYDATTGALVTSLLFTGLTYPQQIAVSGGDIFVTGFNSNGTRGVVGEYTTSGAVVNASLIGGLVVDAIAVSGNDIFISADGAPIYSQHEMFEYTTSGVLVNEWSLPNQGQGIAISGGDVFVADGWVSEYTLSGATVNAKLIPENIGASSIAVSGDDLFVANFTGPNTGSIGEYTTSGATINASLITGLNEPGGIVVVPEPAAWIMLAIGAAALFACGMRRRRSVVAR